MGSKVGLEIIHVIELLTFVEAGRGRAGAAAGAVLPRACLNLY